MDPRRYHDLLEPWTSRLDVWTTEYLQVLEPGDDGEHPVLAWVRGTGLRPVLETLDEADRTTFLEAYASSLHDAYPLDERGRAVYPFRRLFIVAGR